MRLSSIILLALLFMSCSDAVIPEGWPYLDANITYSSTFDRTAVLGQMVTWLLDRNKMDVGSTADDLVYFDFVSTASPQHVKIGLKSNANPVQGWHAWSAIAVPLVSDVVFDDPSVYGAVNASAIENAVSNVTVTILPIADGYNDSWIYDAVIQLSATPTVDNSVRIAVTSASADVGAAYYDIAFPSQTAFFSLKGLMGTHTLAMAIVGGSDPSTRYFLNATIPTYTVGYRENLTTTAPTTEIFANSASDEFFIRANNYRSNVMDMVVEIVKNDTLIVEPSNVTVLAPSTTASRVFRVRGPAGVYQLSYKLADPWMTDSGMKATSNSDFYQPEEVVTLIIQEPLNISIASVPRGYLVNEPIGTWGGAFSTVTVHIEKAPRAYLQLTPSDANPDGGDDLEFFPQSIAFWPGGRPYQTFRARAKTTGYKTIQLTRGGHSASHYADAAPKLWIVTGKNQMCHLSSTQDSCNLAPACYWDAMKSSCGNTTLIPLLSPLPELFNLEETQNITLTLPTAPRYGLTVLFSEDGSNRLTFNPPAVTFGTGETEKNFTIRASLSQNDGSVRQMFTMALSGQDAQSYTQLDVFADIRPRIVCITTPPTRFFVGTESEPFALTCDTSPEVDVTFTPVPRDGIQWIPVGGNAGDSVTMTSGVSTMYFTASSVSELTGDFAFDLVISGTNAVRYEAIPSAIVIVLPSGEVLTPPSFYLTAFDLSPEYNIDVTVQSPSILEVSIEVQTTRGVPTTDVTVFPTVLKYNNTKRNFLKALGNIPGTYQLAFTISGINKANYIAPPPLQFEVKPRLDGKAFEARTQVGFIPQVRCRVRVGRQSLAFKGQTAIENEEDFCYSYPTPVNSTFNCSIHETEERCRNELSTNGNVCVWHHDTCQFLPSLQGKLKMPAYGSGFTVLLTTEGRVFSIGSPRYGQLGHYNDTLGEVAMPTNISTITAGTSHVLALDYEGFVYSWGANYKGQLGQNTRVKQTELVNKVKISKLENITCISSGTLHSGAVSMSGKVFMWGSNEYGQLGTQTSYRSHALGPIAVNREDLGGEAAVALQCGEYHTMVATAVEAYTFGSNTMGQLGRDGFDEWQPGVPVLYYPEDRVVGRYTTKPAHRSWLSGRDNC